MLGIIVQLILSWLIVWLFQRGNLSFFGFWPTKDRLLGFIVFFFISAACCTAGILLRIYFTNEHWIVNPLLNLKLVVEGIWWNIKAVMFEELIFRGVLLYILIKKLGPLKAIIISAIGFGIYHWFSFGIIGNIPQMIIIFFITGIMGLLLAYGYSKTFSLYIPIAIHLGWNFTQIFIFSKGPIGDGIFIPAQKEQFRTDSYFIFFTVTFAPMLAVLLINFLLIKQKKQSELPATNNRGF